MTDPKILEELSRLGAVGMGISESCTICEIEEADFYASPEMQKAYRTGQLKGEYIWRQSIFKGAKDGIPQMCKLFQSLIEKNVLLHNPELNLEDYYDCEIETEPNTADADAAGGSIDAGGEQEGNAEENPGNPG